MKQTKVYRTECVYPFLQITGCHAVTGLVCDDPGMQFALVCVHMFPLLVNYISTRAKKLKKKT